MKFFRSMNGFLLFLSFTFCSQVVFAVLPATCPTMQKRNNGNGLWGDCAGQGSVPVASNVVGTVYENFFTNNSIVASTKTGDINFYWPGVTNITELYVITRVWVGTTILATKVGPPPVPTVRNGNTYATYCFYVVNLPNAGVLTLEFTDPQTGLPAYLCAYDLKSGATVTSSVSCAPTFITQPVNKTICGDTTSFRTSVSGASSYQWEFSSNGGSSWSNVTGADFSGITTANLSIVANASTYSGYKFRLVATGAGSCGSTTSSIVTLTAYPKPTATFAAGAIVCGVGTYNLRVDFTGTGPWSFTYTTNGASSTTVSNIAANPYYLAVSPSVTTTYAITALNDRYCANYSVSAPVTLVVQNKPTITLSSNSITYCYNASAGNATLAYSGTTESPDQYSVTAGSRAMPSFAAVSNASNVFNSGNGNISVAIPAGTAAGTYDFNLKVKKSTPAPGCESETVAFTVVVLPAPPLTVTSSAASACIGESVTLTASPDLSAASPAHNYAWTGGTVGNSTAVSTTATVSAPTTYTVTVTNSSTGCTASQSVSITLKSGLTISVNNATICSGDKAVLTASGASTYSWSLSPSGTPTDLSSTTGSTVLANPTSNTIYRVTGSSGTGCPGFADATVTVSSGLTVAVAAPMPICNGGSATLTASGATTYSWAPAATLSSSTGSSVTASPTTTTTYTVIGTTGSCTGTGSVTVTVNNPPVVSVPPRELYHCGSLFNGNDYFTLTVSTTSAVECIWQYFTTTWQSPITATSSSSGEWRNNAAGSTSTLNELYVKDNGAPSTKFRVGVVSGTCTTYYYTDLVDLNIAAPVFSALSDQTLCSGGTPSQLSINGSFTSGTGTSTTPVYQWQSSSDGISFNNIGGATSSTYSPGSLTANTWYRIGLNSVAGTTDCKSMDYSTPVKITVVSGISGNTISGTDCSSGPATLTGSAISGGTYQWESSTNGSSWSDIPGATSQNYTAATLLTQKTWFRRRVTLSSCTDVSASTILLPAILGNEISSAQTFCFGGSASSLGTVLPTGGEGTYTYQWQSAPDNSGTPGTWADIGAATTNSYTPPSSPAGVIWYRLRVISGTCTSFSNHSLVNIISLTISASPSTATVCNGTTTTITASGASTYAWSPSTGLDVTAGPVVKATPSSTQNYTVTGTDANGCTDNETVTITVNALPSPPTSNGTSTFTDCNPPTANVNLNTEFISGNAIAPEEYRWYTENINPPVSSPVSNPTSNSGTYYAFTYNTTTGCYSSTSISGTVNLKENAQPTPLITSYSACSPATYNLRSAEPTAPSGTTWYWRDASLNTVANPTSVGTAGSTETYYLYGVNGTCTTANSTAVAVTINSLPLSSVTVSTEQTCSPNKVDISDNYTNTGDIYQWYTVNSNPTPATLVSDPTQVSAGTYYLFVTRATTLCQSSSPATATVTINSPPTVSITTPSLICEGSSVNIVSSVSSGSPTYQWYSVNTSNNTTTMLANSSPYSNVTTSTLSVNPTNGLSEYLFYVTATESGCSASSSLVPIPMATQVSCTSQPSNSFVSTLPNGTYFSFSVDDFNANVQWQLSKDGGTTWRTLDPSKSYDAAIYYGIYTTRLDIVTVDDSMNNFEYRAIATTSPCTGGCTTSIATLTTPISLPVSGMKLTGVKSGDQLELKWFVISEEDVDYYSVMYAENGQDFTSVGKVWVQNPSFTAKSYSYRVPPKKGYYKIQAVSERQASVFSNLYWYQSNEAIKTGINPNPVQADKGSLLLSVSGVDHELPFRVNVHGVDGRLIQSAEMKMQSGTHVFQLNDNALSGSLVILSIVHPDQGVIQRKKVIIQH
jgi:hypothetical protein